jgi:hypothetical protein
VVRGNPTVAEGPQRDSLPKKLQRVSLGPFVFVPSSSGRTFMSTSAVSSDSTFNASDLDLIADAFAMLFFRAPQRRPEIVTFGSRHPELHLFYPGEEPPAEEDR